MWWSSYTTCLDVAATWHGLSKESLPQTQQEQAHGMVSLRRHCPDQVLGVAKLPQPLSLTAPSSISQT